MSAFKSAIEYRQILKRKLAVMSNPFARDEESTNLQEMRMVETFITMCTKMLLLTYLNDRHFC
jgi:hypothetical protein